MMQDRICVGAITGSFGVKGEARIKSFCAEPSDIANYNPLTTEDGAREFSLTITRALKGGFAAHLGTSMTKESVDSLKGTKLYADRDALPNLPDDEYYYSDLIGLEVFDTGGEKLGRINALHDHGAGDLLEIVGPDISGSVLLPFTNDAVPTVDLSAGRIVIDPPAGIFSDAPDG